MHTWRDAWPLAGDTSGLPPGWRRNLPFDFRMACALRFSEESAPLSLVEWSGCPSERSRVSGRALKVIESRQAESTRQPAAAGRATDGERACGRWGFARAGAIGRSPPRETVAPVVMA